MIIRFRQEVEDHVRGSIWSIGQTQSNASTIFIALVVIILEPLLALASLVGRAATRRCPLSTLRRYVQGLFVRDLRFLRIYHLLLNDLLAIDCDLEVVSGDRLKSCGLVVLSHVINLLVRDLRYVVQELVLACVWDGQVLPMAGL